MQVGYMCIRHTLREKQLVEYNARESAAFWPSWNTSPVPEGPIGPSGTRGLFYKGQLAILEHAVCSIRAKTRILALLEHDVCSRRESKYISNIYLIYIRNICLILFSIWPFWNTVLVGQMLLTFFIVQLNHVYFYPQFLAELTFNWYDFISIIE